MALRNIVKVGDPILDKKAELLKSLMKSFQCLLMICLKPCIKRMESDLRQFRLEC